MIPRVIELSEVCAVVVLYHPDQASLDHVAWLRQYVTVITVDNTERQANTTQSLSYDACRFGENEIINDSNLGIASALNQGLERAKLLEKKWCLLLDQDSVIDADFLNTIVQLPSTPVSEIAALVPRYYAANLKKFGDIIQVQASSIHRVAATLPLTHAKSGKNTFVAASYAITSGSLVNLSNIDAIGLHDEDLFIDFVDIEWGLRANSKGFKILTNLQATLLQQLGDDPIQVAGKTIVNHSPIRHYYYFRNAVHMLKKAHVPVVWKLYEIAKLPIRFILYSTLTVDKKQQCTSMLLGLWHGIQNKKGKKTP